MSQTWLLLHHAARDPAENMAWDEALLESAPRLGRPILRFYRWATPAATFGYFQRVAEVERLTALRPLIRRPTGGGLVPHDGDWTYSVVVPAGDPWFSLKAAASYQRVHEWIRAAFAEVRLTTELSPARRTVAPGQCFVGAERFDVLLGEKKIAGAAQRRTRSGLLIQGSIQPPPNVERSRFEAAMLAAGSGTWQIDWVKLAPDEALSKRVSQLAHEKYSREEFNRRR
jgi:lipoate-protein ligase A